jgi:hypothetical protein
LSTTTGINGNSTGTTSLYTVPAGKTVLLTEVLLRVTTGSGITTDAQVGIGVAAGEDDIVSPETLVSFRTTSDAYKLGVIAAKFRIAVAGDVIKLGIDTAANGTLVFAAELFGYIF